MYRKKIYSVADFGVSGDGATKDTAAVQRAIDTCHEDGGGVVVCPPGAYLVAPLILRSGVTLHLEEGAVILGSADPADYADWQSERIDTSRAPYNARYLLIAEDASDIAITGRGTINGQGPSYYDQGQKSGINGRFWKIRDIGQRPGRMIWFIRCRNVTLEDVTFLNAPAWTLWLLGCENVDISNLTILTPFEQVNADGIDVDSCRQVRIRHCRIKTGDDAIILRAINRVLKERRPCEQVTVENCALESNCNAVRFSYVRDGSIRDVSLTNVSIRNAVRGIICQIPTAKVLLFPPPKEESDLDALSNAGYTVPIVENLSFTNISIEAKQPIWFFLDDRAVAHRIANIRFENIRMAGTTPSVIKGNAETPIENVSLRNVHLTVQEGAPFWSSSGDFKDRAVAFNCCHCRNLEVSSLIVEGGSDHKGADVPIFDLRSAEEVRVRGLTNRTRHPGFTDQESLAATV